MWGWGAPVTPDRLGTESKREEILNLHQRKINNALVCEVTGAHSQTFKAARVTAAP